MAKFAITHIVLLSFISGGLTLAINDFFGLDYRRLLKPEEPQVVEIVRWQQPVCLSAAPGVPRCSESPNNSQESGQSNYDETSEYLRMINGQLSKNEEEEDDFFKKLTPDDSLRDERSSDKEPSRPTSTPKLLSPRIKKYVQLENMGSSTLQTPVPEGVRQKRYLRLGSQVGRIGTRRETVYATKVIDSPVVATLVAVTCLPEIGVPLCNDVMDSNENSEYVEALKSADTVQENPKDDNEQQRSSGLKKLKNFLGQTNLQTNEKPEIKPVLVVQPASSGLLSGINGLFMPAGGYLFNIFNKPVVNKPQVNDNAQQISGGIGFIPGLIQLPQIPSLQEILYKPENDISDHPSVLNVFGASSNYNNHPGSGPPTQSPGIFGGLFSSPSKPQEVENTNSPSLLGGISNIFHPTSKPLVIESPDHKPIVVEKPVYVVEQPVLPGLLDIFQTQNKPIVLNSAEKPEIIKEPVYVLQKPTERPPLFGGGLLPNWNIFSKPNPPHTSWTTETPIPTTEEYQYPAHPIVVINKPPSSYKPVVVTVDPQLPSFPDPPKAKPGTVGISFAEAEAAASSSGSGSYGISNSESTAVATASASSVSNSGGSSTSIAVAVASAESSVKDLETEEINLQESSVLPENDLDGISSVKNVNVEVEAPLTSENTDLEDQTLLAKTKNGFESIDSVGIKEQIDNEA